MERIPDANFYDDAESEGANSKLIAIDDENDIHNMLGEFAVPIDGTTLLYLLELAAAYRATHNSWLDDSDSGSKSSFDLGAGSELAQIPMRSQISFNQS